MPKIINPELGQAWANLRSGQVDQAVSTFDRIIQNSPQNVDAYYGLGLAQRALGNKQRAIEAFQQAYDLAQDHLEQLRAETSADSKLGVVNNLKSIEDDRYMMLIRMLSQRLAELGVTVSPGARIV
ncbi:MAG: tetratricopeptide repeat protein [Chloroflexi bacterium]|nr:MAG: tetratricopeptide repeat protein [Chloroflexota bacterium]